MDSRMDAFNVLTMSSPSVCTIGDIIHTILEMDSHTERRSKVPHGCVHAVVTRELNYVSRGWQQQMHAAGVLQEQPRNRKGLHIEI